jgi:hypothetical protein
VTIEPITGFVLPGTFRLPDPGVVRVRDMPGLPDDHVFVRIASNSLFRWQRFDRDVSLFWTEHPVAEEGEQVFRRAGQISANLREYTSPRDYDLFPASCEPTI